MDAIGLFGVQVVRQGVTVLDSVDLTVAVGERLGLIGASGSGKTSLLRVMAGLDRATAGRVEVAGTELTGRRREVTMVFSQDAVYDHLDVTGNLDFPFRVTQDIPGRDERIAETADRFSLHRIGDRRPSTLSAGQRQVVAAARALVRPEIDTVLLDEPLVGTDPHRRHLLVEAVIAEPQLTVVLSTNDPADVVRWCGRVAVLAGGTVAQVGSPADVHREPGSLEIAELMGELNRLPAVIRRGPEWMVEVGRSRLRLDAVPAGLTDGQRVVVGVRPTTLSIASRGIPFDRCLSATVGRVEPLGGRSRLLFGLGDQPGVAFVGEVAGEHRPPVGSRIDWFIPPERIHLYDPSSGWRL
jgi:ABC-type sugar transport system ATPase subunit